MNQRWTLQRHRPRIYGHRAAAPGLRAAWNLSCGARIGFVVVLGRQALTVRWANAVRSAV